MSAWRSLRRYSSKEDLMRDDVIYLFSFGAFNSFERFLSMRYNKYILNSFSFFYEFKHSNRLLYEERFHHASAGAFAIERVL